jgi:hypothetical protein
MPQSSIKHLGTAAAACPERSRRVRPSGRSLAARDGFFAWMTLVAALGLTSSLFAADCIPIQEAGKHVGDSMCVTGYVQRVKVGAEGVHFLDFCEDHMACPFTVVVFESDLKDVGDVRRLAGRTIEIRGPIKLYEGQPEIILNRISQIRGGAAMIPPLPKNYDVENRGHYSAGRLRPTRKPARVKAKPNATATYGYDVEGDDPPQ